MVLSIEHAQGQMEEAMHPASPFTTAVHVLEHALMAQAHRLTPFDEASEAYSDTCMTKADALNEIGLAVTEFLDTAIRYANADISAVNGQLIAEVVAEISNSMSVVVAQFERVAEEHRQPPERRTA